MTLTKDELEAEMARLTHLINERIAALAKWDPSWGDYKAEVMAVEGQAELVHELNETIEKGDEAA